MIENHMVPGNWILVLVVCQGRGEAEILCGGDGRREEGEERERLRIPSSSSSPE